MPVMFQVVLNLLKLQYFDLYDQFLKQIEKMHLTRAYNLFRLYIFMTIADSNYIFLVTGTTLTHL